MRVLHVVKTSHGADWALRQMGVLVSRGVDVHVVLPAGGPRIPQYRAAGVTVHEQPVDLPMRAPHRWPLLFRAFRALVDAVAPDIIHSHFVSTTLLMRMALGRNHPIPRIFQVPGPLHLEHAPYRLVEIGSASSQDSWIASCQWTRDRYLLSGIPENRVRLAYYGMDLGSMQPASPGRLRAELQIASDVPVVGMVAYMYAPKRYLGQRRGLKGHEDLIDAMVRVRRIFPQAQLALVGGAWNGAIAYEQQVYAYARSRLGQAAHLLGTRTDIADLYADFNVAVHPSHSENLGGAAESLALGVPTIASNVGGFPDIVIPGQTGWLAPDRNPDVLAEAIIEALSSPEIAAARARQGQELVRELLDVRTTAAHVHDAYYDVVETAGNREEMPQQEQR